MTVKHFEQKSDGFTLIELIIAMAIFSFMLLIMTVAILSLFRIYEAGGQIRNTQKHARLISQSLNGDIHTARGFSTVMATPAGYREDTLCLFSIINNTTIPTGDGEVYFASPIAGGAYQLHKKTFRGMPTSVCVTGPNLALYPSLVFTGSDQKLTDDTVSLTLFETVTEPDPTYIGLNLSIVPVGALGVNLVNITTHPNPTCNEANAGSQYCAITNLTIGGTTHKELQN